MFSLQDTWSFSKITQKNSIDKKGFLAAYSRGLGYLPIASSGGGEGNAPYP